MQAKLIWTFLEAKLLVYLNTTGQSMLNDIDQHVLV